MSERRSLKKLMEELMEAKKRRRQRLANLPFEEKVAILLRLQKLAKEVRQVAHGSLQRTGREVRKQPIPSQGGQRTLSQK